MYWTSNSVVRAFARSRGEDRRLGQDVALRIHVLMRGANGPGRGYAGSRPGAAWRIQRCLAIQQEIHAVLFQLDRIRSVIRDSMDDFDRG